MSNIAYKIFTRNKYGYLTSLVKTPQILKYIYSEKGKNIPVIDKSEFFCFKNLEPAQDFLSRTRGDYPNATFELWKIKCGELTCRDIVAQVWEPIRNKKKMVEFFWQKSMNENSAYSVIGCYSTPHIILVKKLNEI